MQSDNICQIPVRATFRVIDGKPVMTEVEYTDIPADVIARMILQSFGLDAILCPQEG